MRRRGKGRTAWPAWVGAVALVLCACGDRASEGRAGWKAARDTVGDTVVVRTVAGSAWGGEARLVEELRIGRLDGPEEYTFGRISGLAVGPDGVIHVVDAQAPALRTYAPDGSHLADLGRAGQGPGEIANTDGGVAVLPDGRALLRDPGNARINVYAPDGTPAGEWQVRGGNFTSTPLVVDTAGRTHHQVFDSTEDGTRYRLVRFAPDGSVLDTLPYPEAGLEVPQLEALVERGGDRRRARRPVPFSPTEQWTFSPLGYFVGGTTDRYAVTLLRPEGPLRIERAVEPVPVRPEERADARERATAALRNTDPAWRWNGPPIPDRKPYWRGVFVGEEGRVWVRRHVEAEPVPEEELEEPQGAGAVPPARWRDPVTFDVFEPDGRFLGTVLAPPDLLVQPRPVVRGEVAWAVARDELGVPYVVRYRIGLPAAGNGARPSEAGGEG